MKFKIKLHLLPTAVGGRKSFIAESFRADWKTFLCQPEPRYNCGQLQLPCKLGPGQTGQGELTPMKAGFWKEVRQGQQLGLFEGSKMIGLALVLEVL